MRPSYAEPVIAFLLAMAGPVAAPPPPADPLSAQIHSEDADRFAALFERTGGAPSAEQIQREYLDRGSYGVHVFMDGRIENAAHMARVIARKRALYADAIRRCLPVAKRTVGELRAIYLSFRGLLPERPLPQIYLVFGADNSGGTAGPGAQVLGLETLCAGAPDDAALRTTIRGFYAHETVHTWQSDPPPAAGALLNGVLVEGAADFLATLVTGRQIDPARAAWAAPRETELWRQFATDLRLTRGLDWAAIKPGTPAQIAVNRWIGNYGNAPTGWPVETGYWMGQRIWERWYARQPDKPAAIRRMLAIADPQAILDDGRLAR